MSSAWDLPNDVVSQLHSVFDQCNSRITEKLTLNPNTPEESLDLTWIETLTHYASPITLDSGWTIKIETHFLGGMRHFHGWEIADIGVLVFLRLGETERRSKVALLQSKRLYPEAGSVQEETVSDFEIGFARLADPEAQSLSIALANEFSFTGQSKYGALKAKSAQVSAITDYQDKVGLDVYYQFYNPWQVPLEQEVPLFSYDPPEGSPTLGVRLLPAESVHAQLGSKGESPTLADLDNLAPLPDSGWRLEHFICEEVLGCRQGNEFESTDDERIQTLFNRRTGAIAGAIAVSIEAPGVTSE